MPNYVIIAPTNSTLSDKTISDLFPDRQLVIRPGAAWAVSTALLTCADVRDHVRSEESPERHVVVVKATEYNGYAKREIWDKMEAWERS